MAAIYRELIAVDVDAKDREDVIRKVGKLLFDNGFVKDTYVDAVLQREKTYPTGLRLQEIDVAMPHTFSEHVNKPAVCIVQLRHPIAFQHMGEPEIEVQAELLFMMAIVDPHEQIDTLKSVMKVFQSPERVKAFREAKTAEELYETAVRYIQ